MSSDLSAAPVGGQPRLPDHVARSVESVAKFHQEHYRRATTQQRLVDTLTDHLGRPLAVLILLLAIGAWAAFAVWKDGARVDQPSFAWLELGATVAAFMVSVLILVTQRRADQLADRRDQLTLELALLADKKSAKIIALLEELRRDHPELADRVDLESEAMAKPADPEAMSAASAPRTSVEQT